MAKRLEIRIVNQIKKAVRNNTFFVYFFQELKKMTETGMDVRRFSVALQLIAERVIVEDEEEDMDDEIDDTEKWMVTKYLLPLLRRLSTEMAHFIHDCKDLSLLMNESSVVKELLDRNRVQFQAIYTFYSHSETTSKFKLMSFKALFNFATDFSIVPDVCDTMSLHALLEAINWIHGESRNVVVSYDKFLQLISLTPLRFPNFNGTNDCTNIVPPDVALSTFLAWLDGHEGKHRIAQAPRLSVFVRSFTTSVDATMHSSSIMASVSENEHEVK